MHAFVSADEIIKYTKKISMRNVVKRIVYPEVPPGVEYELTVWGCP